MSSTKQVIGSAIDKPRCSPKRSMRRQVLSVRPLSSTRASRSCVHVGCGCTIAVPLGTKQSVLRKTASGLTDLASVGDYLVVPLAQSHGVHLSRAVEKISGVEASPEIARLLQVEAKKMLLKLDRVIYSADAEPIEWRVAECNLHGEYYVAEM